MIRVQNVYYMLAYAFQVLHEQGYKNVATEEFDNVAELLSAILCRGVSVQIKRGLIRQYISREEALASPRGKLEIGESIKTQVIRKKQLVCNYDEFSVDAYPNRIIKTTMDLLLRGSISKARKKEIRKLMIFFDGISILDIHSINWDIQYDRNNQTYRMLIAVCRFVIKGLLQTTADGSTKIMDYADDAAFQTYIDYIKQQSAYPTSAEVTTASKIVSLSTCTNVRDDERFLVHGVMIKEEAVK